MASLKEIKSRIASVRSTLKITSAMKMVAASKLHHAQQVIAGKQPYSDHLYSLLADLMRSQQGGAFQSPLLSRSALASDALPHKAVHHPDEDDEQTRHEGAVERVALVAFSSNSSLCGGFNAGVIRQVTSVIDKLKAQGFDLCDIDIHTVGRKVDEALRRQGITPTSSHNTLAEHPDYAGATALANVLTEAFEKDEVQQVILVYNHFVSTATQRPTTETFLPMALNLSTISQITEKADISAATGQNAAVDDRPYIMEPNAEELFRQLLPKALLTRFYTVLLDANAAEHAARTVAMQTASDNADKLLDELTLAYNKSRQQKITAEILDLVGGLQR